MRLVIWKGIWAHKIRLVLVSTAIMLGVAFVAGSFVLTNTVGKTFDNLFADVYKDTDAVVRGAAPPGPFEDIHPPISADLRQQVAAIEGVTAVGVSVEGIAQLTNKEGNTLSTGGAPALGDSWEDNPELNPFRLTSGVAPKTSNEVVIDAGSANKGKYSVGDEISILTAQAPQQFKISGIAKFGDVDSPAGASVAMFTEQRAQELFGLQGKYSQLSVVGASGVSQEQLRERIAGALGPSVDVVTGKQAAKDDQSEIKEGLSFFTTILLVFAGISLFVGAFVINNIFAVLIAQRTKELALLRAIGARGRQVLTAVLAEALIVGLIASFAGLGFGILLALAFVKILDAVGVDLPADTLSIGANAVVASLLCGVVVTLVSSYFPARRAARVPPLAAMRDVAVDRTRPTVKRVVFGLVLLIVGGGLISAGLLTDMDQPLAAVGGGAALTFIAVNVLAPTFSSPVTRLFGLPVARARGISGVLARENAARNPRRTSATASALMIGVALVTMFTVLFTSAKTSITSSIDNSFAGDFVVQGPQFGGGLPVELEERLKSDPQVDVISAQRYALLAVNGSEQYASAVDPQSFDRIYDTKMQEGSWNDVGATGLAVTQKFAEDNDLKLGQTVDVTFAERAAQKFDIAAIFEDAGPLAPVNVSLGAYDANVDERFDSGIFVRLKDGVTVDQARPALEQILAPYPNADLQDSEGLKESITSQIQIMLNILYGLLGLAIVIALLGIATTLALSVFERTHEIGLLRAVGMSRRQLRSTIRWESVVVAVFGTVLGFIVGIVFAMALVTSLKDEGFNQIAFPWATFVVIVVLAAVSGVLAAIWPAHRAAKQNVLAAISTT